MSLFSNPIGKGLTPERVDMGVDYGGSGPLYALGNGTITNLYNSGWPGGTFLTIHLDSGQYIYYAENVQPLVQIGQKVKAGDHIANATGGPSGIEVGWAQPPGTGNAMAAAAGQASKSGDPGAHPTAYGELMSNLIAELGGPAGKTSGTVIGSVPASFGITAKGNVTQTQASLAGGLFSFPTDITNFFSDANKLVTGLMWLVNPQSWVRIGAFLVGVVLLLFAIRAFIAVGEGAPIVDLPKVVPIPV